MMRKDKLISWGTVAVALVLIGLTGATAKAAVFNLTAKAFQMTMPDGRPVTMWGFSRGGGDPSVPGPVLEVPAGDDTLTIQLTNQLPVPVSLWILGQDLSNNTGPVWTSFPDDTVVGTGSRPTGDYRARVRSFAHETAPGATQTYTWSNFKAGTYLLQSGTNPAVQVQMGLYAAVKKNHAAGRAYSDADTAFDGETILVFSEVDPAFHHAVTIDMYGHGKPVSSAIDFRPRYFLLNGKAFPQTELPLVKATAGETILVRFLNAGIQTYVAALNGPDMTVIAEDGYELKNFKSQYSVILPPAKTTDVLISADAGGNFALFDRRLHLTNAQRMPGGMLTYVSVDSGFPSVDPAVYSFAQLPLGSSRLTEFTITNNGGAPLTLEGLAIQGSHEFDYSLGTDGCSGHTLAVGQSCQVQVAFTPTDIRERRAFLSITSSNAPIPALQIPLWGRGCQSGIFSDTTGHWAQDYMDAIYCAGITTGCQDRPLSYCPGDFVTRAQMAAFLVRAIEGEPPGDYCDVEAPFSDTSAADPFCKYIKRVREHGITMGVAPGIYGGSQRVDRAQMAAFLVRAIQEKPNTCTAPPFTDVPVDHWACGYIGKLKDLGITVGKGDGTYGINDNVTRDQMAAFLARAFHLTE